VLAAHTELSRGSAARRPGARSPAGPPDGGSSRATVTRWRPGRGSAGAPRTRRGRSWPPGSASS
jgi:hypothetical protein